MNYANATMSREAVDAMRGIVLLEFGANGCGYCARAQPAIEEALAPYPRVRHVKVEDGKGRPLGRSFGVTLWPTLIFLQDGKERSRLVRPVTAAPIVEALEQSVE